MRSEVIYGNTFYNGDCISGAAAQIPDDSIDLIITDPPYGISCTVTTTATRGSSSTVTSRSPPPTTASSAVDGSLRLNVY